MFCKKCLFSIFMSVLMVYSTVFAGFYSRDKAVLAEYDIPHGPLPARHETHAATITEARDGTLIAAWFGGSYENAPDIKIWASRKEPGASWSEPVVVDDGNRGEMPYACWNPVLFTNPDDGMIYCYYKITGTNDFKRGYHNWWGAVKTSTDNGLTWSERIWLPDGIENEHFKPYQGYACGPVKNRPIILPDGSLLCGSSTETKEFGWRVHFERYQPGDWTGRIHGVKVIGPLEDKTGIQPSFLVHDDDSSVLQVLIRDKGQAWSYDGGKTWTDVAAGPITTSKGLHSVTLKNGWHFLVFNPKGRQPLSLARSRDGKDWQVVLPELSVSGRLRMDYPTIMQAKDGNMHVVHSWGRDHIKHLVLDSTYLSGPGRSSTATAKQEASIEIDASLKISGGHFEQAVLREGGKAFSNRRYTWRSVPEELEGSQYTQTAGGVVAQINVAAKEDTTVYVATATDQAGTPELTGSGWKPLNLSFNYTDSGKSEMHLFSRKLAAGEAIEIPQSNWTGTIVIAGKNAVFSTSAQSKPELDTSMVPGTVIVHSPAKLKRNIGSPSIAILPNGDYVASHDFFGPGSDRDKWDESHIYKSSDKGKTWKHISVIPGQWWSNLFWHNGALYICGTAGRYTDATIRRSTDYGRTWTVPKDENTGLLIEGICHTAPVPMVVHDGRIWRAMEFGNDRDVMVMSAPVSADLLKRSSWRFSSLAKFDKSFRKGFVAWREANAVVTPEGGIAMVMRVSIDGVHSTAAWFDVNEEGTKTTFDPATGFFTMPGATGKKFTIRYDDTSKRYWASVNPILPRDLEQFDGKDRANNFRNCLAVASSADLKNWTVHKVVAYHPDHTKHGFQYPDFEFEGGDMLIVSRTAYDDGLGGAYNYHDANFMTFHRVEDFRDLVHHEVYAQQVRAAQDDQRGMGY